MRPNLLKMFLIIAACSSVFVIWSNLVTLNPTRKPATNVVNRAVGRGNGVIINARRGITSSNKTLNSSASAKSEKNRQVGVHHYQTNKTSSISASLLVKQHSGSNKTTPQAKITSSANRNVRAEPAKKKFIRPWNCSGCFHWNYHLVVNQEDICKSYVVRQQTIDLIFLIPSTDNNLDQRNALRQTWGSVTRNNTSNFRHVFFFGASRNAGLMRQIVEESRQFRDVVVNSGFDDTYRNLTFKTMTLLRWLTETCPQARFFLKVDDDMWINTRVLLSSLVRVEGQLLTATAGSCRMSSKVIRHTNKWSASKSEYPSKVYPHYCSGTAYAGTVTIARQLVNVSANVPFFHLEDIFVGLCLKLLNYKPMHISGFHHIPPGFIRNKCEVWKGRIISLHHVDAPSMRKYWEIAAQCGGVEKLLPRIIES